MNALRERIFFYFPIISINYVKLQSVDCLPHQIKMARKIFPNLEDCVRDYLTWFIGWWYTWNFQRVGVGKRYRQWLCGLTETGEPGKASVTASWQRPGTEEAQHTKETEQVACRSPTQKSHRSKCDCSWTASHLGSSVCCGLGWIAAWFYLLKNS